MLSLTELKDYAYLRDLSVRDIEAYCDLSAGHISNIFNGNRALTDESYRQITNAINAAYVAKKNGSFKRAPLDENKNAVKETEKKPLGNGEKTMPKSKRKNALK